MSLIPKRTIKSWVSRQSAPTPQEAILLQSFQEKKIYFPFRSDLEPLATLMAQSAKNYLDIGFGDGQSLAQLADFDSEACVVGIEPHLPGVIQMLRRLESEPRPHVRVACSDVYELFALLPHNCLDRVHIYFSDPWPKTRHHKRRLIQKNLWDALYPLLKNDGYVHIATDWQPYAEMIEEDLLTNTDWCYTKMLPADGPSVFRRQPTKYERKALAEGRMINEFIVRKKI